MYVYDPIPVLVIVIVSKLRKHYQTFMVLIKKKISQVTTKAASDLMKAAYEKCKADGNI